MDIFDNRNDLNTTIDAGRAAGKRVGFVPTMGALHDGHLSLVEVAKAQCDLVVVSIFVNPTQFAPGEDFEAYPRDTDRDVSLLESAGVDCVYLPTLAEIYPEGAAVSVNAGAAAQGLESHFRPHFFDGVCSVVHRLFEIVRPDVTVFGEKDYQQLMVIREMVAAHDLDIEVLGAPIVRDEYGLALSSRNAYLSVDELAIARKLNSILGDPSLRAERSDPKSQEIDCSATPAMTDALLEVGFDKVDYIDQRWGRVLAAAWIGKTRLIDNMPL